MIRLNADLIDALASENALGTQTSRVRRRMQTLQMREPELAARVAYWQAQLNQLSETARPVPVPPWVWRRIETILQPPKPETPGWWQNLLVWRWTTGLATAMAVLMTLFPPPEQPRPDALSADGGVVLVLTDEQSKTAWLVSRQSLEAPIKAQAITVPVMTVAQAYELWLLPPGGAPLSLGLLNEQGGTVMQPATAVRDLVQPGVGMAVSIEPPGGSPTGAPTGPVVYSGSILSL
jgi:anti-sigma-K factor RskA